MTDDAAGPWADYAPQAAPAQQPAPSSDSSPPWQDYAGSGQGDTARPLTIQGSDMATPVLDQNSVAPQQGGWAPRTAREPDYTPDQMRGAQQQIYAGEAQRDRQGNYLDTLGRGIARAVPFMDDISAAGDTAASYLGLNTAPVGSANQDGMSLGQRYQDNLDRERAANQADDTDRTYTSLAGQVGGALALPTGALGKVTGFVPKIAAGAALGTAYGGAYGFGQGDSWADRVNKAETGAKYGAIGGALAPALISGAGAVVGGLKKSADLAVGAFRPGMVAEKRVSDYLARDMQSGSAGLSPTEWQAAQAAGAPITVADAGGEATRALARSAANTSPEASAALKEATGDRYKAQASQLNGFLGDMFGSDLNNTTVLNSLKQGAAAANQANYNKAYASPAAQSMWNEDFQRIVQAPDVQDAIKTATKMAANKSVATGVQKIASPFMTDEAGNLVPRTNPDGSTVTPTLRFWDQVSRALKDKADTSFRAGSNEYGSDISNLRKQLLANMEHPETGVPEFNQARTGAYKAFAAEDALDAGQKFASAGKATAITDQQEAVQKMSGADKELFARGFASQVAQAAQNSANSRNVSNMFDSEAFRVKARIALGPTRSAQLEAHLRLQGVMNRLKESLGNSTTAKQQIEMGLASGLGTGAFEAFHEGSVTPKTMLAAAAGFILHKSYSGINEKTARRVGELLASNNPKLVANAVRMVAQRPQWLAGLRAHSNAYVAKVAAERLAPTSSPVAQPAAPSGFKRGGRVDPPADSPAVKAALRVATQSKVAGAGR